MFLPYIVKYRFFQGDFVNFWFELKVTNKQNYVTNKQNYAYLHFWLIIKVFTAVKRWILFGNGLWTIDISDNLTNSK